LVEGEIEAEALLFPREANLEWFFDSFCSQIEGSPAVTQRDSLVRVSRPLAALAQSESRGFSESLKGIGRCL